MELYLKSVKGATMKVINEFTMTVEAKSINEGFARSAVAAFCAQLNPTLEEIGDIKTAISEAVTNCIVHGYQKKQSGKIDINVKLFEDNKTIEMSVEDFGIGIKDVKKAMQTFYTTCNTGERSGMGFTVMEAFTDKLEVVSTQGKGTLIKMTKIFGYCDNEEQNGI